MNNTITDTKVTARDILNEAKSFKENCEHTNTSPNWFDYEHFKRKLQDNGIFGAEPVLATILGL